MLVLSLRERTIRKITTGAPRNAVTPFMGRVSARPGSWEIISHKSITEGPISKTPVIHILDLLCPISTEQYVVRSYPQTQLVP
jgi:hypothetical protein